MNEATSKQQTLPLAEPTEESLRLDLLSILMQGYAASNDVLKVFRELQHKGIEIDRANLHNALGGVPFPDFFQAMANIGEFAGVTKEFFPDEIREIRSNPIQLSGQSVVENYVTFCLRHMNGTHQWVNRLVNYVKSTEMEDVLADFTPNEVNDFEEVVNKVSRDMLEAMEIIAAVRRAQKLKDEAQKPAAS